LDELNLNEIIEKIKDKNREEIFRDEPLEGIFRHKKKKGTSLKFVIIYKILIPSRNF
jgi:hypothetical protein